MALQAQFHVSHPDLVLAPTIREVPEVTVRTESQLAGDAERPLLFYSASGARFDDFEAKLDADRTVADWLCVAAAEDRRSYRLRLSPEVNVISTRCAELGIRILEGESSDGGWYLRTQAPDREALAAFREHCRERGVAFRVDRLCDAELPRGRRPMLTSEQRETLVTAYREGYFGVPRATSQDELASTLGVSGSAVSQRLRRAMAQLVSSTFPVDDHEK